MKAVMKSSPARLSFSTHGTSVLSEQMQLLEDLYSHQHHRVALQLWCGPSKCRCHDSLTSLNYRWIGFFCLWTSDGRIPSENVNLRGVRHSVRLQNPQLL